MRAHAITINMCFWGNRTAATATLLLLQLLYNTKRTIKQGLAITSVTCVGSLSGLGGTIIKKGGGGTISNFPFCKDLSNYILN